jgi:hypothetical protein
MGRSLRPIFYKPNDHSLDLRVFIDVGTYSNLLPSTFNLFPMAAITKRRRLGLLTHAVPYFLFLGEAVTQAFERHAIDLLMSSVTKGLLLAQAASAPGVIAIGCNGNTNGFIGRCFRLVHNEGLRIIFHDQLIE